MVNSDQQNFKIDPNDRIEGNKRRFGPMGPPKTDKDFKDFLPVKEDKNLDAKGKSANKSKFDDELTASNALAAPVDHPGLSLFDLSAGKKGDSIDAIAGTGTAETADTVNLGTVKSQMGTTDGTMPDLLNKNEASTQQAGLFDLATNKSGKRLNVDANGNLVNPTDARAILDSSKKTSKASEFVEENADLISIAQSQKVTVPEQIQPITQIAEPKPTGGPDYKTIQQIVDQIVDKIYLVKEDGRSDTTIVLRNPPLFDGVKITLSSYESAAGQFNITFENLTQMAKNVLDFQANRDALRLALDNKGVVIQMFTTTTATDTVTANWEPQRSQRDQQGFDGQGQQQKNKDEEQT